MCMFRPIGLSRTARVSDAHVDVLTSFTVTCEADGVADVVCVCGLCVVVVVVVVVVCVVCELCECVCRVCVWCVL